VTKDPVYTDFSVLEKALLQGGTPQDFFKSLLSSCPSSDDDALLSVLSSFNYDKLFEGVRVFLQNAFNAFDAEKFDDDTLSPPPEGLKGVYLCLPCWTIDQITIAGSLHFAETDWAANADFYLRCEYEEFYYFDEFYHLLKEKFPETSYDFLEAFSYCLFAYTLVRFLPYVSPGKVLRNAAIAIGYSGGMELVIGRYQEGIFVPGLVDGDVHW
jgi:hypothetical protein